MRGGQHHRLFMLAKQVIEHKLNVGRQRGPRIMETYGSFVAQHWLNLMQQQRYSQGGFRLVFCL